MPLSSAFFAWWYICLPFPVMGALWHCFTRVINKVGPKVSQSQMVDHRLPNVDHLWTTPIFHG